MNKGKIFILSGPSGSGKTTLLKKLLDSKKFKNLLVKSVSVTTRDKRPCEVHGRDYFFISRKSFEDKIEKGQLLEWQKVFDSNYYGTPAQQVYRLLKKGISVLLCIDVKGAAIVREKDPLSISIFIKVPSVAVLRKRLSARGTESADSLNLRLNIAKEELLEIKNYKYVVINDNLKKALRELEKIILKEIAA